MNLIYILFWTISFWIFYAESIPKDRSTNLLKDIKEKAKHLLDNEPREEIFDRIREKLKKLNEKVGETVRRHHKNRERPKHKTYKKFENVLGRKNIFKLNDESGVSEYMYQGDMFLTEEHLDQILNENENPRLKRQANKNPASLWKFPIPYYFDASISPEVQSLIKDTIKYYENQTCVRFIENSTVSPRLRYYQGPGCYSFVGMLNQTEQDVSIGHGFLNGRPRNGSCIGEKIFTKGFLQNLFKSLIKFFYGVQHQQSRYDRDLYVYIDLSKVDKTMEYNYDKYNSNQSENYDVLYDYGSVMHYAANSFSTDDSNPMFSPMLANDHHFQTTMGSEEGPSFNDILLINKHYKCIEKCPINNCKNKGYPNPNDCSKCICAKGFAGNLCDQREPASECGETLPAFTMWKELSSEAISNHTCVWHLTSPAQTRIEIQILSAGTDCWFGCPYGAVEFKIANFTNTGFRFCCPEDSEDQPTVRTDSNLAIIIAFSHYNTQPFQIKYRYVETSTIPTTSLSNIPTIQSTARTATSVAATTTITATTTTKPHITASPSPPTTSKSLTTITTSLSLPTTIHRLITTTLRPPTTTLPVWATTQGPYVITGVFDECADSYSSCPFYLQQGGCSPDSYYYESMREFCKKTCNFCYDESGYEAVTTTTSTQTPYTPPSSCVDDYDSCSFYASMGYCAASAEFRTTMEVYCRKSCNFCNEPTQFSAITTRRTIFHSATCSDTNNYCSHYAAYGDCREDSTYRQWMEDFCPKTCGFC